MNNPIFLRAVPGAIAIFLLGLLLGTRMGASGPLGYIIGICALIMVASAARLYVVQRQERKRATAS